MSEQQRYDLARLGAMLLTIASVGIAVIVKSDDLELSRHAIGWLNVAQACITAAIAFLPRVQGDGHERVAD